MKRLFTLLFLSFTIGNLTAQDVQFGITGGVNISKLSVDGLDYSWAPGYALGVSSSLALSEKWNFRPELLFRRKVTRQNTQLIDLDEFGGFVSSTPVHLHIGLNYVSLPVLFEYKTNSAVSLIFGPNLDIFLNEQYKLDGISLDLQSEPRQIDVGVHLGITYPLNEWFFQFRFNKNFLNALTSENSGSSFSRHEHFSTIELNASYFFQK